MEERKTLAALMAEVNSKMNYIVIERKDKKTGEIIKKNYSVISERVRAFRQVFPLGSIRTEILEDDGDRVTVRAEVYESSDALKPIAVGHAYELRTSSYINQSSYLENCETGAVGRALGFLGFTGPSGEIATADEASRAEAAQEEIRRQEKEREAINKTEAKAFRSWLKENGIPEEKLVATLGKPVESITLGEHKWFINHLQETKEKCGV